MKLKHLLLTLPSLTLLAITFLYAPTLEAQRFVTKELLNRHLTSQALEATSNKLLPQLDSYRINPEQVYVGFLAAISSKDISVRSSDTRDFLLRAYGPSAMSDALKLFDPLMAHFQCHPYLGKRAYFVGATIGPVTATLTPPPNDIKLLGSATELLVCQQDPVSATTSTSMPYRETLDSCIANNCNFIWIPGRTTGNFLEKPSYIGNLDI